MDIFINLITFFDRKPADNWIVAIFKGIARLLCGIIFVGLWGVFLFSIPIGIDYMIFYFTGVHTSPICFFIAIFLGYMFAYRPYKGMLESIRDEQTKVYNILSKYDISSEDYDEIRKHFKNMRSEEESSSFLNRV